MIDERQVEQQVAEQHTIASRSLAFVREFTVETAERCEQAAGMVRKIREHRRGLEADRDGLIKPLQSVVRKLRAKYKTPLDLLTDAENHLRAAVIAYQERERAKQQAALVEAQSKAEVAAAVTALAPRPEGYHERYTYSARVVDPSKVPAEYWTIDQAKLDRVVAAAKGEIEIPGVAVDKKTIGVFR